MPVIARFYGIVIKMYFSRWAVRVRAGSARHVERTAVPSASGIGVTPPWREFPEFVGVEPIAQTELWVRVRERRREDLRLSPPAKSPTVPIARQCGLFRAVESIPAATESRGATRST